MKLKTVLSLITVCSVLSVASVAQTKQKVAIDHVTVFLNGAEIESNARISLAQGENEILMTNIAGNVVHQSISIATPKGVVVQSVTPKNDYLVDENLSPFAKLLKDSIDKITDENSQLANKNQVVTEQMAILKANQHVAGENSGMSVLELQKLLDLTQSRLGNLLAENAKLNMQIKKNNDRIKLLTQQFNTEKTKNYQPGGQLLVKFYAVQGGVFPVNIRYVSPSASWTPTYDIRVDKINTPIKLIHKANITQNTGVEWKNVKLSLSTSNPSDNAESPYMNPWYLSFYQPIYKKYERAATKSAGMSEMMMAPAPSVGAVVPSTLNDYVTINNNSINTVYDIALNYNIPADGQEHLVSIKDYDLNAAYRYFAIPKLNESVFLQAQIIDWENLNLIPGTTNIFFENTYVGQGYLNLQDLKDTMNISLGKDKKIIIKRENDKNYRSVKTIGTNTKHTLGYTIDIKNTKQEVIDLTVLDQFPISNDKDITIEDRESKGASVDESNGEVSWSLKLKPNEQKILKINFTVKYPNNKNVQNL